MKILIAEDSDSNYVYMEALLKHNGYEHVLATDGQQAIDICKKDDNIDLIFMDIRMPVKDGFEAFDEIKKINPDIKIIAQTAHAMEKDRETCLDYGFDDYIAKPFDPNTLLAIIEKNRVC